MQKILIIQLRQLGDIILTTPCLRELRAAYPEAKIDFLAHGMGKLILNDNPYLNHLYTYSEADPILSQLRLMKKLRSQKYDLVLDFMYNPRSALLAWSTGSKKRMAFKSRRSKFFTDLVPAPEKSDYIVREKFHYLRYLGLEPKDESLVLPWFENHLEPYLKSRDELFPDSSALRVVLSPTHRRQERQWPKKMYAQLADYLVSKWNAQVVWIWGPGEKEFVEEVQSYCKEASSLAPQTSFRELAAFIANCDLFVGNSNGPSHVAVSCQTPSLQLHGPTLSKAWCPENHLHHGIQMKKMADISLEQVQKALEGMRSVLQKRVEARLDKGDRMKWNS